MNASPHTNLTGPDTGVYSIARGDTTNLGSQSVIEADLVVHGIGQLVTCEPTQGEGPLGLQENAAVAARSGQIVWVGATTRWEGRLELTEDAVIVDAGGRCALPGFVDARTHLLWAGCRADEFAARVRGQPYWGGGIMRSVRSTRAASAEPFLESGRRRIECCRRHGVTSPTGRRAGDHLGRPAELPAGWGRAHAGGVGSRLRAVPGDHREPEAGGRGLRPGSGGRGLSAGHRDRLQPGHLMLREHVLDDRPGLPGAGPHARGGSAGGDPGRGEGAPPAAAVWVGAARQALRPAAAGRRELHRDPLPPGSQPGGDPDL